MNSCKHHSGFEARICKLEEEMKTGTEKRESHDQMLNQIRGAAILGPFIVSILILLVTWLKMGGV